MSACICIYIYICIVYIHVPEVQLFSYSRATSASSVALDLEKGFPAFYEPSVFSCGPTLWCLNLNICFGNPGAFRPVDTVDGRSPASPKKPWSDDSPINTNKQWFPRGFKVVRNGFRLSAPNISGPRASHGPRWRRATPGPAPASAAAPSSSRAPGGSDRGSGPGSGLRKSPPLEN